MAERQRISSGGSGLPSRTIFHAVEKIGKTSLGANFPNPVFSMTRGEQGLLTLIDNGLIGPTKHFEEAMTWNALLEDVQYLTDFDTGHKTYVLDTLNGAERLCIEHVCRERYNDNLDKFLAFGKGIESSLQDWLNFLSALDRLRATRRISILALCHTRIKKYGNPQGDDYDRFTPDMHDKFWGLSHKWADVILFGNHQTFAKKDSGSLKAKGLGGTDRVIYTQRSAAFDAGNRVGLPPEIPMGKTG